MKRVLVLGSTGMLGHEVCKTLQQIKQPDGSHSYDVFPCSRIDFNAELLMHDYATKTNDYFKRFVNIVGEVDFVINAIGVIVPHVLDNPAITFFVNSAIPHILANYYGSKLIHITTDCAYGYGGKAPYHELAPLSPNDIYGLSKSLGEPGVCLTIRTSVIGHELNSHFGLLEWFLNEAKTRGSVYGYTDHLWNGITTHQFALACDKIMEIGFPGAGIFHVFSSSISKYEMLLAFKEKFKVDCTINPVSGEPVDRRLSTLRNLNKWLEIPSFDQMLEEM